DGGARVLVRVHLLPRVRRGRAARPLPQLRGRAGPAPAPSRRQAREVPRVDDAGAQAGGMPRVTPARVLHVDAFAGRPGMGNPARVLLDADDLPEARMQAIARAVGFNETAFVLPSTRADLRLRYFTPGHEVDLCGHATIATFVLLHQRGRLPGAGLP